MWLNSGCKNLSKCFGLEMVVEKFDMIITENGNKKVSYKLIEIEILSTKYFEADSKLTESGLNRIGQALDFFRYSGTATGFLRDVEPILQNGPQCGLVALQMAAGSFGIPFYEIDHIFQLAKDKNYSNHGEIFSVTWLADLVVSLWPKLETVICAMPDKERLIELLLLNHVILVPYDCDGRMEPTLQQGRFAHWCIIIGYLKTSDVNDDDLYVFCMHGKSRRLFLYDYFFLVKSNCNLFQVSIKQHKSKTKGVGSRIAEYIIPFNGLESLRNKCLILKSSYI
ncbi:unnamed protein product [Dracunculus medinensis]|uniref:Actin maturation protease n=1 Tax=Dracunculus medinensis TaxID=318479 RepID=A0A0N4UQE0_DRAME|nr:unnamed protein product [Dracunculus medinensis]